MSEPVPFAEANNPEPKSATVSSATESVPAPDQERGGPASVDLNALHKFSVEELAALAQQFDVFLHPARGRHYQILDLLRGALSAGSTVTAEGFIDPVGDSFALLRWPELNFLPVPEDVGVPQLLLQQFHLRPGREIATTA